MRFSIFPLPEQIFFRFASRRFHISCGIAKMEFESSVFCGTLTGIKKGGS